MPDRGDTDLMALRKAMDAQRELERALWGRLLWKTAFWISLLVNLMLMLEQMAR